MGHLVAPSILSIDFGNLEENMEMLNKSDADWIHVDVMDGQYVPNISFGFPIIAALKKFSKKPLDVHLMTITPEKYIKEYKKSGAWSITVHPNSTFHLHSLLQNIKSLNIRAGVAINPGEPAYIIKEVAAQVDLVLVMSVNPGAGGQKFIDNTYAKISELADMRNDMKADFLIQVDGGVSVHNMHRLLKAGADVLVAGSSIFSSEDPWEEIHELKHANIDF